MRLHELLMKRLRHANSLPDAHILLGLLRNAGIQAHVFNQHAQSGVGQLPVTDALPELWVEREHDYDRACSVLEAFERTARDAGSLRCLACGEDNPANFQLCWNCEAGL